MEERSEVAALPSAVRAEVAAQVRHRRRVVRAFLGLGIGSAVLGLVLCGPFPALPSWAFLPFLVVSVTGCCASFALRGEADPVRSPAYIQAQHDLDVMADKERANVIERGA